MFELTIAIPARNEVALIGRALAAAEVAASGLDAGLVVFANDCTDETGAVVSRFSRNSTLRVLLFEGQLPPDRPGAGHARRLAMDAAAAVTKPGGLLVTTDADAEIGSGTLRAFRDGAQAGADLICGRIATHLADEVAGAPSILRIDRVTEAYGACVLELRHAIDVLYGCQPAAPRPHYMESGACLAITRSAYARIGGLPRVASGEDRSLARRVERHGGQVRYCPFAAAQVSGRIDGRAPGGMADTIRRRLHATDPLGDSALLHPTEMREVWRAALSGLGRRSRPPVRTARHPLRASALERYLPEVQAFLLEVVRAEFDRLLVAAPCSWVA